MTVFQESRKKFLNTALLTDLKEDTDIEGRERGEYIEEDQEANHLLNPVQRVIVTDL